MKTNNSAEPRDERLRETTRITLIGAVVDALLGFFKIMIGYAANSQALIADGIHSLSDLATDAIVLYASKHAHAEADDDHPYGHGRFETVATVILGVALIGVAIGIGYDAVYRLLHSELISTPGAWALGIAFISVISKEAIYRYTMVVAEKHNSNMLRANAWHSRSDAISSVIVIIGVAGSMLGIWYLDGIAAIAVALMIAKIGWDLLSESMQELVDTSLDADRVDAIKQTILDVDGVDTLHVLRTRKMGSDALVDVHIQVNPTLSVSEGHFISETVRSSVIEDIGEVTDVMVHIDPEDDELIDENIKLPLRHELINKLESAWQDVEASQEIIEINLHYLNNKIAVELVLPVLLLEHPNKTILEQKQQIALQFKLVADSLDEVESIKLLFQ